VRCAVRCRVQNGLREGKGKTTLPNGVVHAGVYKDGWLDYATKCTLAVPAGAGGGADAGAAGLAIAAGTYEGKLSKDLTFELSKGKKKSSGKVMDFAPLLGAESLLTSQR
jgi:hypothetical protein